MTERDQSRDRPGDEMVRVTVTEAARRLGISEAGVRKRIQRGQIPYERGEGTPGRVWVWVSPGEVRDAPDQSRDRDTMSRDEAPLVEELRHRLHYVENQLQAEREAHAESRRLLLAALEKIPPAIVPPAPPEPTEAPTAATEQPGRVGAQPPLEAAREPADSPEMADDEQQGRGPIPDAGGPQEATERRWWEFWR
jgi:hypothetical protein